jgi:hypothetical protein
MLTCGDAKPVDLAHPSVGLLVSVFVPFAVSERGAAPGSAARRSARAASASAFSRARLRWLATHFSATARTAASESQRTVTTAWAVGKRSGGHVKSVEAGPVGRVGVAVVDLWLDQPPALGRCVPDLGDLMVDQPAVKEVPGKADPGPGWDPLLPGHGDEQHGEIPAATDQPLPGLAGSGQREVREFTKPGEHSCCIRVSISLIRSGAMPLAAQSPSAQ